MNISRDNQIARDIISGKITELYCIREGYIPNRPNLHTVGVKYKVWFNRTGSINPFTGKNTEKYHLKIANNINITFSDLASDTNISDYFETSLKNVRKRKLLKIKGDDGTM